jgi:hypothetical protein
MISDNIQCKIFFTGTATTSLRFLIVTRMRSPVSVPVYFIYFYNRLFLTKQFPIYPSIPQQLIPLPASAQPGNAIAKREKAIDESPGP